MHGDDWLVGSFNAEDGVELLERMGHHYTQPPPNAGNDHINIKEMRAVLMGAQR